MPHACHALRCTTPVPPKMLMCKRHWFMVPKHLRDAVWAAYRPGQEADKDPSASYVHTAMAAVRAVAEREAG